MIPIDKLPDGFDWSDIAIEELRMQDYDIVSMSDVAYRLGNVAVAGLIYYNYLTVPWFWFALAKGVTLRDLLDFRRFKEKIPLGAETAIRNDRREAIRFAELYGFENTGKPLDYNGVAYSVFRRV